mmetsp:Transcript_38779/g.89509  ORF Transcript_38779/g.89509 Transcript_38779/m.89509 type:complete len:151 (-) Transcript_38779:244-696(-)
MGVMPVSTLLIALMAVCPQLALSAGHSSSMIEIMCINETHYAVAHGHSHDDEDEDDEDDMNNMSRRLDGHGGMHMDDYTVMMATDSEDPCGSACNTTCTATECTPMECELPMTTTTATGDGSTVGNGATHAACAGAVLPLVSLLLASFSS